MSHAEPIAALREWARDSPDDVAVAAPDLTLTAKELWDTARQCAGWMSEAGIDPAETVAVAVPESLVPTLTTALLIHGAVGTDYLAGSAVGAGEVVQRIIAARYEDGMPREATVLLDTAALDRIARVDAEKVEVAGADAEKVVRITFSSGSTGAPKAIAFTRRHIVERLESAQYGQPGYWPAGMLIGSSAAGAPIVFLAGLVNRRPFIVPGSFPQSVAAYRRFGVRTMVGSPYQLEGFLKAAREVDEHLPDLVVAYSVGAAPAARLASEFAEWFGVEVHDIFGSTEAGSLSLRRVAPDPQSTSRLYSDVQVEIVDDHHHAVTAGTVGWIRVRPSCVPRYLGRGVEPVDEYHGFRDGWFYSGDLGSLVGDQLRLVGRADDVINAGGLKLLPGPIEEAAQRLPEVHDAIACGVTDTSGARRIALAFIGEALVDPGETTRRLRGVLGASAPNFIVRLPDLPRSESGKALRREVEAAVQARLTSPTPPVVP